MSEFRRLTITAGLVAGTLLAACSSSGQGVSGVTEAEFKAAAQQAADCVAAEGWTVDGPRPGSAGVGYIIGVTTDDDTTPEQQTEIDTVLSQCWQAHVGDLEHKYYQSLALTGQQREAAYGDFVGCLEAAGVTGVSVGDPEGDVGEAIGDNAVGVECMQKYLWLLFRNQDA